MSIVIVPPFLRRFLMYMVVGVSTYILDILLLYVFKTYLLFPDILAMSLSFLIAISCNFLISYWWVFKGTRQTQIKGYVYFLIIAGFGLVIIVVGTLTLQYVFSQDLYTARSIMAAIVGIMNYVLNAIFNFKMIN